MSMLRIDNLEKIINIKFEFPPSHAIPLKHGDLYIYCTKVHKNGSYYHFEFAIGEYRPDGSGQYEYTNIFTWILVKIDTDVVSIIDTATITNGIQITIDTDYDSKNFCKYFEPYINNSNQTNFIRYIDISELTTPMVFVESVLKLFTDYHNFSYKFLEQLN